MGGMTTAEWILIGALAALALLAVFVVGVALRLVARNLAAAARAGRLRRLLWPFAFASLAAIALVAQGRTDLPWFAANGWVLEVATGVGLTWFVSEALVVFVHTTLDRYDVSREDNLRARQQHTRYRVLLRITLILIWTLGTAAVLATFPEVRAIGTTLLASAGIAGLVLGLAAQRTIGNFLAGIQIALTQPVRLDDAVVIDDEWGWVEDITTTFVVVRLWDERRLVVPFNRLLEQSFQNWTRSRADLIGSVHFWADYRVPVAALRRELQRVLGETELWDGRVAVLQVVESSEKAVQLRALVSASSSPRAWDLRCYVREKLVTFLAEHHPTALPSLRAEVDSGGRMRSEAPPIVPPDVDEAMREPQVGGLPGEPGAELEEGAPVESTA